MTKTGPGIYTELIKEFGVMSKNCFVVRGNLCYSPEKNRLVTMERGWLVCEDGRIRGAFEELPKQYSGARVLDFGDCLVLPGLTDLHLHAPQYSFRSLGMDMELMEWLDTHTFPEEARYRDLDYARRSYEIFANDLKQSATTRAVIFATLHVAATRLLMDLIETSGVKAFVGKVNMDRNCPAFLCEESVDRAISDTRTWIEAARGAYKNVKPILTPRFTPACSMPLLRAIGELQKEFGLPVQSHLSENPGEIQFVRELEPDCRFYGETYDKAGLFGENGPAVMAHCVYCTPEEMDLMKERGVFIAHCPQSNINLASGIAPARRYMDMGLLMGLGSDIAGGYSLSIFRAMADAVGMSKMYWRYVDNTAAPLSPLEAFYLGTKGGGAFFGKCGSFEPDYAADFVALDDTSLPSPRGLTLQERLERLIFLSDSSMIKAKYVEGVRVL